MTQTVYCLVRDNGDSSCSIEWYCNVDTVEAILNEDDRHYLCNEGTPYCYNFPDDFDFQAAGIEFSDPEYFQDVKSKVMDWDVEF